MENTVIFVPQDGEIIIADASGFGAANPNRYVVDYENGDLSTDLVGDEGITIRDRKAIVGWRATADPEFSVTFTVHMRNFADSDDLNLMDVLEKTNAASTWASTAGVGFEGHFFDVKFTEDATTHQADAVHGIIARKCRKTGMAPAEGEPGQVSVTVQVLGGIERFGDGVVALD